MSIHKKPAVRQIQPIGFWGRLEAIRAPTRGKARKGKKITRPPMSPPVPHVLGSRVAGAPYKDMMISATLAKNMATERPASDHANHEAARVLIPPTPRPWSLAPSVTTLLYRATVSQTLRQALRSRASIQLPRIHLLGTSVNRRSGWLRSARLCGHGSSPLAHRALRLSGRLLRGDAGEYGRTAARRDHPIGLGRSRPAGPPGRGGRHRVRHPRGGDRGPDRLLGGPRRRQAVRPQVGAPRPDHARAPGACRGVLRSPRGQGGLPGPLLRGVEGVRGAGGWDQRDALEDLRLLQRPGGRSVGDGGGAGRLLPGQQPRLGGALAGKGDAAAWQLGGRGGVLLPGLPLGGFQQGAFGGVRRGRPLLPAG